MYRVSEMAVTTSATQLAKLMAWPVVYLLRHVSHFLPGRTWNEQDQGSRVAYLGASVLMYVNDDTNADVFPNVVRQPRTKART